MRRLYRYPLILTVVAIASYLGFRYVFVYFIPFILGGILACILDPVVNYMEARFQFGRGPAVLFSLSFLLILLILILTLVISGLYVELNTLVHELPDYRTMGLMIENFFEQNEELFNLYENLELPPTIIELMDDNIHALYNSLEELLMHLINSILNTLKGLPGMFLILIISCITAFFFSRDKRVIRESFFQMIPERWIGPVSRIYDEIARSAIGFIRAELALILITTVVSTTGLYIIGSDYALILGFTAGILDLIPLIGPSMLFVPWTAISVLVGNFHLALYLILLLGFMAVIRQMAEAKIIGAGIGIHPLLTLIAIYVGIQVFGITGILIGPMVLITLKAIFNSGLISFHT